MNAPSKRAFLGVAGVLVVAVVATSCGVPTEDGFRTIGSEQAPFVIETTVASETTGASDEVTAPSAVYLIDAAGSLVRRPVDGLVSVTAALELLTAQEVADDVSLRSALQTGSIVSVDVTGRSLTAVDLAPAFVELPAEEQGLAIAQVVLTATDGVPAMLVAFSIGGEPIDVPRGDSSVGGGAVSRTDYAGLIDTAG